MTPREADVLYVLESVAGVRSVFALDRRATGACGFDFAVEIENERSIAEAHYALLRVLTHDECARIHFFRAELTRPLADRARLLALQPTERERARERVPLAPFPREEVLASLRRHPKTEPLVLVITKSSDRFSDFRKAIDGIGIRAHRMSEVTMAGRFASTNMVDLFLCDARLAVGSNGLLRTLPSDLVGRVLVLAGDGLPVWEAVARSRGAIGVIETPIETERLREHITRALEIPATLPLTPPEETARRRLLSPGPADALNVLLVDVEADIHEPLRRAFPGDARHVSRENVIETVELAFATPFHLVVCSGDAATHPRSFLDALALEDPIGADGVLLLAPARDVPYVRQSLEAKGRKNTVLALPLDDAALQRELHRRHPSLGARAALAEHATERSKIRLSEIASSRPRFRRLSVLIVDDDMTTQMSFSAGSLQDDADVSLATTSMEAFEHVTNRPVDVLLVSATMRAEGGEPIYRILWRLVPNLKSRSFLIVAPDLIPPSTRRDGTSRAVTRPLDRERIRRLIDAARPQQ